MTEMKPQAKKVVDEVTQRGFAPGIIQEFERFCEKYPDLGEQLSDLILADLTRFQNDGIDMLEAGLLGRLEGGYVIAKGSRPDFNRHYRGIALRQSTRELRESMGKKGD